MSADVVDNKAIKVRVKAGGEGTVAFDSAIALLQGLYPPNPSNKIVLANETVVMAPLGGYQYVPGTFSKFDGEKLIGMADFRHSRDSRARK